MAAKIDRVQAFVDWRQEGQHHDSLFHLGGRLSSYGSQSVGLLCAFLDKELRFHYIAELLFLDCFSFVPQFSSVQFSRSVVSSSLQPHESQHARPPCPSPTPGVHSDSCPSSQWCHPAISSSVIPFSSCPQSLPASESFPMSQLFTLGGRFPHFPYNH